MTTDKKRKRAISNKSANGTKAVSYLRTSSATNVGTDKDSESRQRDAISRFADASGFDIVNEYYDAAVSGADPIETRPGFRALLDRIESNGVRVVIVEDASRFARELMTQELGILSLIRLGVRVLCSNGDDLTDTADPMKKAVRQIAGAFAELEKARLVAKLKSGRDKRVAATGRCGGRIGIATLSPEVEAMARKLRRAAPSFGLKPGKRMSLRDIAAKLAEAGHMAASGKPYSPSVIKRLLGP